MSITGTTSNPAPDRDVVDMPLSKGDSPVSDAPDSLAKGEKSRLFPVVFGLEFFNLGNIVLAGTSATPLPILPSPNFNRHRLNFFNEKQDQALSALELTNATLTNGFGIRDLAAPRDFRTDGIAGLGVLAIDEILNPAHVAGLYRGMLASQQDDKSWYQYPAMANAGASMVVSGIQWQQLNNAANTACSPWQAENFAEGAEACNDALATVANGGDAVLNEAFGSTTSSSSLEPAEGLDGALKALERRGAGLNAAAYGMSAYALFQAAENNGNPSLMSLAGLAPLIIEPVIDQKMGQPLDAGNVAERLAIGGGAFALTALSHDKATDFATARNYAYLLGSPSYPPMMELTTLHLKDYENSNSAFMLTPFASVGGYALDSVGAGLQSGKSLRLGETPFEKFAPLALNLGGLGIQYYANATDGDPSLWKLLALGTVASGAGLGLGYATAGKKINLGVLRDMNFRVSADSRGASASVSGRF